jgi:UDP-N-acetyl-D-glucosamine dehydrogenase
MSIQSKLADGSARLGVIGLGYVGLPLAVEYARAGYEVVGTDVSEAKVARIREGRSYVGDVSDGVLAELVRAGKITATTDTAALAEVDSVNICVPTPLSKTRDPDISYINAAVDKIVETLHPGQVIILESTTYPGTTEEVILPRLQESGLTVGKDFFLAFSPERVDPGNARFNTRNIPKVVGGITPECTRAAAALYEATLSEVVPVSSARVAETVKLLENTFRSVNVGLVNEIAMMCHKMGIDVWEVIDAAGTKPFGFMPFYPGPGLGGHCIPIDPFYLSWKARASGFEARFIELAGVVNGAMPEFVVDLVSQALNGIAKPIRGSRILVVGVAYKGNIDDTRESPALDVIEMLRSRGGDVAYFDPHVPSLEVGEPVPRVIDPRPARLKEFDCAVITTVHAEVDHRVFAEHCATVVDTRNALSGVRAPNLLRL